jgi:uncharacterized protein YacL
MDQKKLISFGFWHRLMNSWTFVFFAAIIYDFIISNKLSAWLNIIAAIYVASLAIYVSNKEFERWNDSHTSQHPGELFVFIWTALILSLFVFDLILERTYELPNSVLSAYLAVLTVLAITSKSKSYYLKKKKTKKKTTTKK